MKKPPIITSVENIRCPNASCGSTSFNLKQRYGLEQVMRLEQSERKIYVDPRSDDSEAPPEVSSIAVKCNSCGLQFVLNHHKISDIKEADDALCVDLDETGYDLKPLPESNNSHITHMDEDAPPSLSVETSATYIQWKIPEGTYFLGDPCLVMDAIKEPNTPIGPLWKRFCKKLEEESIDKKGYYGFEFQNINGANGVACGVQAPGGDGTYVDDQDGDEYIVDSGMIGLTSKELWQDKMISPGSHKGYVFEIEEDDCVTMTYNLKSHLLSIDGACIRVDMNLAADRHDNGDME